MSIGQLSTIICLVDDALVMLSAVELVVVALLVVELSGLVVGTDVIDVDGASDVVVVVVVVGTVRVVLGIVVAVVVGGDGVVFVVTAVVVVGTLGVVVWTGVVV